MSRLTNAVLVLAALTLASAGTVRVPGPGGVVQLPPPPPPSCNVGSFTQAAIQTQLDTCASGGSVFLPAGTYSINSSGLTMPGHPITVTGVRALSVLQTSSGTPILAMQNNQTLTNLVFSAGCVQINGSGNTLQYNKWLDSVCTYSIQDFGASNNFIDHNVSVYTTVCTALCTSHMHWYSTLNPQPNNVEVSYNYIDGYWEAVQFLGYNASLRGNHVNVHHNVMLHGVRMAVENGTPIDTHHIDNNYMAIWATIGDTDNDPANCGVQPIGSYSCNSFAISMAGGASTAATINGNRAYGSGSTASPNCNFGANRACAAWGIEMTAVPGQLAVNGNTMAGAFVYGIWDDPGCCGDTGPNRAATANNFLCNIAADYTRSPSADGWGSGNVYSSTCPTPDPIPCPPFDPTTGGTPTGCGGTLAAFPGASGAGASGTGGRGGSVIEVTNLNDSGTGSLRACMEASGARTCVFRLAGIITLASDIVINNPFLTVAGQTAPGSGITLRLVDGTPPDSDMIRGMTHDITMRYIRLRPGRGNINYRGRAGLFLLGNCYNVMIDHVSSTWSAYDTFGTWGNLGIQHDVTFSYNIGSEGLSYAPIFHAKSFNTGADSQASIAQMVNIDLHHNLFSSVENRAPLQRNKSARLINNVIYNTGYGNMNPSCGIDVDIVGNKIKRGPHWDGYDNFEVGWELTGDPDCASGNPTIFINGNLGPHNPTDLNADNWPTMLDVVQSGDYHSNSGPVNLAFRRFVPLATQTFPISQFAASALDTILFTPGHAAVGASARLNADGTWTNNWDAVDARLVNEYLTNSGPAVLPTSETDVGGYPAVIPGTAYADTNHDGIPDVYAAAHGLSVSGPGSNNLVNPATGYTWLEDFLNGNFP